MANLNQFNFTGRLTKDAVVKNINGKTLVELDVANNVGFGDFARTNWLKVEWWGDRGANAAPIFTKGALVSGSGEISLETYTTKEGAEKAYLKVKVFGMNLEYKKKEETSKAPDYDEEDIAF